MRCTVQSAPVCGEQVLGTSMINESYFTVGMLDVGQKTNGLIYMMWDLGR